MKIMYYKFSMSVNLLYIWVFLSIHILSASGDYLQCIQFLSADAVDL